MAERKTAWPGLWVTSRGRSKLGGIKVKKSLNVLKSEKLRSPENSRYFCCGAEMGRRTEVALTETCGKERKKDLLLGIRKNARETDKGAFEDLGWAARHGGTEGGMGVKFWDHQTWLAKQRGSPRSVGHYSHLMKKKMTDIGWGFYPKKS